MNLKVILIFTFLVGCGVKSNPVPMIKSKNDLLDSVILVEPSPSPTAESYR